MASTNGDAVLLWTVKRMHMLTAVPTQLFHFSYQTCSLDQEDKVFNLT